MSDTFPTLEGRTMADLWQQLSRMRERAEKAEAELRHCCLCRWESIDGDVRLRHECDGHKQTRLGRNAALALLLVFAP